MLLAAALAFAWPAAAAPAETPGAFVERVVAEGIARTTGAMPAPLRRNEIASLLDHYVDIPSISRVALGRLARGATDTEKREYFRRFEDLIVSVFVLGAENYSGEKLNVVHVHPVSGNEVTVSTEVLRPAGQKFAVDWILVIGDSAYQVQDIVFENISARMLMRDAVANLADKHGGRLSEILPLIGRISQDYPSIGTVNPLNPFNSISDALQNEKSPQEMQVQIAQNDSAPPQPVMPSAPTLPTVIDAQVKAPFEPTGTGARFLNIFGYLSVLIRGCDLTTRIFALGGFIFLLLMRLAKRDADSREIRKIGRYAALGLAVVGSSGMALEVSALLLSTDLGGGRVAGADFILAGSLRVAGALGLLFMFMSKPFNLAVGLPASLLVMTGSVMASHSFAQIDLRAPLLAATFIHELAASAWIGGIPYFLASLKAAEGANDRQAVAIIGRSFSLLSMTAVAFLLTAGAGLTIAFTQSFEGFYATAYGTMVGSKIAITLGLLLLGAANYTVTERLRRDPSTPILRLRRFAETEIGVGITVLFVAASLTSLPPAKDLADQRPSFAEIVERMTPKMPSLSSPSYADLSIPQLQSKLDDQAKQAAETKIPRAYIPGWVDPPPANAADILWSEYNHHWSGIFVLLIGIVSVIEQFGVKAARNWPLIFLGLAVFLFIRSDPSAWPTGEIGFWESMLEPEVFQHRIFVVLIVAFGIFEWRVRTGRLKSERAALVFPLAVALGGALLLSHSHSLGNFKEELLIEITHLPLGLSGILAAWARWIELRLPGTRAAYIGGWVWRLSFVFIGFMLLTYKES